jgi:hypothetical protein
MEYESSREGARVRTLGRWRVDTTRVAEIQTQSPIPQGNRVKGVILAGGTGSRLFLGDNIFEDAITPYAERFNVKGMIKLARKEPDEYRLPAHENRIPCDWARKDG